MKDSNLDWFWHHLRDFVQIVECSGLETDPNPLGSILDATFIGESITATSPEGFAYQVRKAIQAVDSDQLSLVDSNRFDCASRWFAKFCSKHGYLGEPDDDLFIPNLDDADFVALRKLVISDAETQSFCKVPPPTSRPPSWPESWLWPAPEESKRSCPPDLKDMKINQLSDATTTKEISIEKPKSGLKAPSTKAIECFRLMYVLGEKTQKEIARLVYGNPKKQGQVSKDIRQVKKYLEAGNVLPDLDQANDVKVVPRDPATLDQIPRSDRDRVLPGIKPT